MMKIATMPIDKIRFPDATKETRRQLRRLLVVASVGAVALSVGSLFVPEGSAVSNAQSAIGVTVLILMFLVLAIVSVGIYGTANVFIGGLPFLYLHCNKNSIRQKYGVCQKTFDFLLDIWEYG